VDQRDMEKEGQNGKRKGGIERKMFFLDLLFLIRIRNPKGISNLLHFLTLQDIFFINSQDIVNFQQRWNAKHR
jgi:hypothetical protein